MNIRTNMRKTLIMTAFAAAALLSFTTAQAVPITGSVQFAAVGDFTPDATNPTGVNFYTTAAECSAAPDCTSPNPLVPPLLSNITGNIVTMITDGLSATGSTSINFALNDINLSSLPQTEWTIDPVATPTGALGSLVFDILSGHQVDNATTGFVDLAGTGEFKFVCNVTDACGNYYTDTLANWSVSNTGGGNLIVGINVPAPATIGILGCALLLFGVIRRRKRLTISRA